MRRFRYLRYALIAVGLYLLWSFFLLPVSADRTGLCGTCHATKEAYQTTQKTKHKNIGCLKCHREPGFAGAVENDLRGLNNFATLARHSTPTERRVNNDACLACHDKILAGVTRAGKMKMSHKEVIIEGWRCSQCHGNTGHVSRKPDSEFAEPSMDKCFGCHLSRKSLRRCSLCHIGEVPQEMTKDQKKLGLITHGSKWKEKTHGTFASDLCTVCHKRDFCTGCHDIDLPHPKEPWSRQHSITAIIRPESCKQCHQDQFCNECHGVPMPHPDNFYENHVRGAVNTDICSRCHLDSECAACHRAHRTHNA